MVIKAELDSLGLFCALTGELGDWGVGTCKKVPKI